MLQADSLNSNKIFIKGKWFVARPMRMSGLRGLLQRFKDTFEVIIGTADAVKFHDQ